MKVKTKAKQESKLARHWTIEETELFAEILAGAPTAAYKNRLL